MLEDIGKLPSVEHTITEAKTLTVFLYAHTWVLDLMRKFIGKDLVRSGVTMFATAYLNLKSLLDNKKQLMRLFRLDDLNEMGYLDKAKGKKASRIARSETFWKGVNSAVNFFEPLAIVLRRMDSDVPAMGFLYGCLLEAKNEISARFDNDLSKVQQIFEIIDKRWNNKLKTPLHRAGYYLNPHYYYPNKVDIELDESFRECLITCSTKMVDNVEVQDQIIQELQQYQDGDGTFGKEIAKRQLKNKHFDPAKWWLNHGTNTPRLRKLAARILSLTCSSSACERNWSTYEQVHTKRRKKLQHARMKDLIFVKFNSKLKQKRETKIRDPIEKTISNILEDEDNEWITGSRPNANSEQEQERSCAQGQGASSSQGAAAATQPKRRGVQLEQQGNRKRKKLIPVLEEVQTSSSESENVDLDLASSPAASDDDDDNSHSASFNLSD
nr:uncharacterized protein LOC117845960 [Setaria viridis]